MDHTGCPSHLWLYCVYYVCDILNFTAHKKLNWRTPFEKAFGQTPDISPYLYFTFFEAVYYYDNDTYPETRERLGYWLGVTQSCGDAFTFYIYKPSTNHGLARSVVRSAVDSMNTDPNLRAARNQSEHVNDEDDEPTEEIPICIQE